MTLPRLGPFSRFILLFLQQCPAKRSRDFIVGRHMARHRASTLMGRSGKEFGIMKEQNHTLGISWLARI